MTNVCKKFEKAGPNETLDSYWSDKVYILAIYNEL